MDSVDKWELILKSNELILINISTDQSVSYKQHSLEFTSAKLFKNNHTYFLAALTKHRQPAKAKNFNPGQNPKSSYLEYLQNFIDARKSLTFPLLKNGENDPEEKCTEINELKIFVVEENVGYLSINEGEQHYLHEKAEMFKTIDFRITP